MPAQHRLHLKQLFLCFAFAVLDCSLQGLYSLQLSMDLTAVNGKQTRTLCTIFNATVSSSPRVSLLCFCPFDIPSREMACLLCLQDLGGMHSEPMRILNMPLCQDSICKHCPGSTQVSSLHRLSLYDHISYSGDHIGSFQLIMHMIHFRAKLC